MAIKNCISDPSFVTAISKITGFFSGTIECIRSSKRRICSISDICVSECGVCVTCNNMYSADSFNVFFFFFLRISPMMIIVVIHTLSNVIARMDT